MPKDIVQQCERCGEKSAGRTLNEIALCDDCMADDVVGELHPMYRFPDDLLDEDFDDTF